MAAYTAIDNPELYFQVKLWTGTGSEIAATLDGDENMQPDFVAIKARTDAESFKVYDSVRGVTKHIEWDTTDAEAAEAEGLKSFDSDGFTIGTYSSINASSSHTYVAWCWKAGTSFSNDASATSVGNTDSSGTASSTAGFSISTYAGSSSDVTVKHGLSVTPAVMWIKNLSSDHWAVYHHKNTSAPETDYLKLSDNSATTDDADAAETWLDTAPASAIATFGDFSATNRNTDNHVGYFWNEVQGYSKFGSYTGNGDADGPFIYTGFKPAFILTKVTSDASGWALHDNKRTPFNVSGTRLLANTSGADIVDAAVNIDFLSNGFKIRNNDTDDNGSGRTHIYMAFAEAPFVNSEGVPCNAR